MKSGPLVAGSSILSALLTGCTVGPDHDDPARPVIADWHEPIVAELPEGAADLTSWWERFGDPDLVHLVEAAVRSNPGLEMAASRVREARHRRAVATGELGPVIDLRGSFDRSKRSENELFGVLAGEQNQLALGFDASWEIDVFGRVQRGAEAADAEVGMRVESYRDALVTLIAEVARNYVELRALQQQLEIANENERIQRDTLDLTQSRFGAGLTGELDVAQARSNLAGTRAVIPPLLAQSSAAKARLAVLLGADPGTLDEVVPGIREQAAIPVAPARIAVGLPSDLLRRRPDLRRAEREVAAAAARIGVATADLYPSFSLTGSAGLSSQEESDLFESDSFRWAFGPSLTWNVFATGRVRTNIRAVEEVHMQALISYEHPCILCFVCYFDGVSPEFLVGFFHHFV